MSTHFHLTREQEDAVKPLMVPGKTVLCRVYVERYRPGMESHEIGRLMVEAGAIRTEALDSLREAIRTSEGGKKRSDRLGRKKQRATVPTNVEAKC